MRKKIIFILLSCMMLTSSCVSYAAATTADDTVVVTTTGDDVYVAAATGVATAVLLDYIWAWNGSSYYRYYCTPYYAPRPYFWHGPRHYAPRGWRRLPPARPHYRMHPGMRPGRPINTSVNYRPSHNFGRGSSTFRHGHFHSGRHRR